MMKYTVKDKDLDGNGMEQVMNEGMHDNGWLHNVFGSECYLFRNCKDEWKHLELGCLMKVNMNV